MIDTKGKVKFPQLQQLPGWDSGEATIVTGEIQKSIWNENGYSGRRGHQGAGEIAVKCLICEHEGLSLYMQQPCKKHITHMIHSDDAR